MVQQLRKSITALVFFAISASAIAQAPSAPLAIKPDAPDRYVVVPGDTLWGISQKFTDSPWRWPELWGFNKGQIRNAGDDDAERGRIRHREAGASRSLRVTRQGPDPEHSSQRDRAVPFAS